LLFSAIFRKMAKTHLHLPFPKMSNEIDLDLRIFRNVVISTETTKS